MVFQVDLKYYKELKELNDYPLVSDQIEIKKQMLPNYPLKIAYFYKSPLEILKNWGLTFLIKKSASSIMKTCNFI